MPRGFLPRGLSNTFPHISPAPATPFAWAGVGQPLTFADCLLNAFPHNLGQKEPVAVASRLSAKRSFSGAKVEPFAMKCVGPILETASRRSALQFALD